MTICLVLIDALYDENSQSFLFKVNLLFRAMTLMHLNETKRKALVSQVQRNFD